MNAVYFEARVKHVCNVAYGKYVDFFGVKNVVHITITAWFCQVQLNISIIYIDHQMQTNYINP
jgi:hypothetical protein